MQLKCLLMARLHKRKELATLDPGDPCFEGDPPCKTIGWKIFRVIITREFLILKMQLPEPCGRWKCPC